MKWARLPYFQSNEEVPSPPAGWSVRRVDDVFEPVPKGRLYALKDCAEGGRVPVLDQSEEDVIGFHNDAPGIEASGQRPVVTFANHTCEMRWVQFPFSVIQNVFPMVGRNGVCETRYFYYATKGRVWLSEYKGHYPDYRRAWLPLPPLDEQRRIAAALGALDDKIELNRKMNRTLEAMAQAIFQSWFIDFDGHTDRVDSELGPIPRGWAVGLVGDEFKLTMGQSPPGDTYNENGMGVPLYQGATDFGFRFPTRRVFCTKPTRLASAGDTIVSIRAPVGRTNMAEETCCLGRGVAGLRHRSGSRTYTYATVRRLESRLDVFNGEGTVFGSINKTDFGRLQVVVPPEDLIERFNAIVAPTDDRVEVIERQSRTLAALRDTLLPKLISGELRIPEAEAAVEATT